MKKRNYGANKFSMKIFHKKARYFYIKNMLPTGENPVITTRPLAHEQERNMLFILVVCYMNISIIGCYIIQNETLEQYSKKIIIHI